jgi:hypothetical protein
MAEKQSVLRKLAYLPKICQKQACSFKTRRQVKTARMEAGMLKFQL